MQELYDKSIKAYIYIYIYIRFENSYDIKCTTKNSFDKRCKARVFKYSLVHEFGVSCTYYNGEHVECASGIDLIHDKMIFLARTAIA